MPNPNAESHFSLEPNASIERSVLDLSFNHKLTGNFGDLIPFACFEYLPGDTFKVDTSIVIRLQTLLAPVMDDAYADIAYFAVPNRLTLNKWKEFMGENTDSAWIQQNQYSLPLLSYPNGGFQSGTIADYLGVPIGVAPTDDADKPHCLPFRAYALICDTYYRDQNLTDPLNIPLGTSNQTGTNGSSYINDVANGGKPFKVAKLHDMFTSLLPAPQKASPVAVPITKSGTFPVVPLAGQRNLQNPAVPLKMGINKSGVTDSLRLSYSGTSAPTSSGSATLLYPYGTDANAVGVYPTNLAALVDPVATTINDLRLAFQLQRFYEKQAAYGSRYRETIKAFFGVESPDSRMMVPEYLGGHRVPIVIHQVANNSEDVTNGSYLGDLGAMSNTSDVSSDFVKSFTEHGYIIGVMCLRTNKTYSQGLDRHWSRRTKEEFYWPTFAHLGNQPVLEKQLYMSNSSTDNNTVFGYSEAWAEYRYLPSRTSGEMRPQATNSLAHWHFGDYYAAAPTLSDGWIREDKSVVDRALAVTSATANQFFADIFVSNTATRPMPVYSIPGLIDHF